MGTQDTLSTGTRGKFISFEGGEGAGKSSHIKSLATLLESHGYSVVLTREPGGTEGGEQIRRILKEGDVCQWDGLSEALLFYASRHDLVEKVIRPGLASGKWVLADRFADSSLIYQGVARGLGMEKIQSLHQLVLGDFYPHLTFFLDVPVDIGLKRVHTRAQMIDRFEEMGESFHHKVREGYKNLAASTPRIITIDAGAPFATVQEEIVQALNEKFNLTL